MKATLGERLRALSSAAGSTVLATVAALAAGYFAARAVSPTLHSRYLPWITGRALGLAAYVSLVALVVLGLVMRHPWRLRLRHPHPETRLRVHAALGAATVLLVVGHLSALAADSYAGVGWWGALVPGMSRYRKVPVGLGVAALLVMVLVGATAGLAGRRGTRHWLAVHRLSLLSFVAVWVHAVFAGSDTPRLRLFYLLTGGLVAVVAATRFLAGEEPRPARPAPDASLRQAPAGPPLRTQATPAPDVARHEAPLAGRPR